MLLVFFRKLVFLLFMLNYLFVFIHSLIVDEYGMSKSTSHILSAPLSLECTGILS